MKSCVSLLVLTLRLCSGNTLHDRDARRAPRLTIPRGGGIFSRREVKERDNSFSRAVVPSKKGDGIFSRATNALESTVPVTEETKKRAKDLVENSADRMAAQALKVARAEQAKLEKLILDYRKEVEDAAQDTSAEIQKMAVEKAALAEQVARQRAMDLSASVEEAAREKLQVVQDSIIQRAYELDEKVTNLITTGSLEKPKPALPKFFYKNAELVDGASVALIAFGLFSSLCNLFGRQGPDFKVWETTGFLGDWSVRNKQILAAFLELASVTLMVVSGHLRKVGAGVLAAIYGHGVVVANGLAVVLAAILALFVVVGDVAVSLYYDNY